jgi:hypothetical protein
MDKDREVSYRHHQEQPLQAQQSSIPVSDELSKLANLKQQGMISAQQMKQDLINKKMR